MENLNERTPEEIEFRLEEQERLLCKCTISGGTVVLDV